MRRAIEVGVCAALAFFLWYAFWPTAADEAFSSTVQLGGVKVVVMVADTPELRVQGLSGRSGLQEGQGMLFVPPESGAHGIWMKDMLFSIDTVWISEDLKVVHLEEHMAPESYPKVFYPQTPARYMLELPAGFIEAHNIRIGSQLEL